MITSLWEEGACLYDTLPGFSGKMATCAFISGEQRSENDGKRGTKVMFGHKERRKSSFLFLETREQSDLFQWNKGRYTPGRVPFMILFTYIFILWLFLFVPVSSQCYWEAPVSFPVKPLCCFWLYKCWQ